MLYSCFLHGTRSRVSYTAGRTLTNQVRNGETEAERQRTRRKKPAAGEANRDSQHLKEMEGERDARKKKTQTKQKRQINVSLPQVKWLDAGVDTRHMSSHTALQVRT